MRKKQPIWKGDSLTDTRKKDIPLLTISIPTYNRAKLLKDNVLALLSDINKSSIPISKLEILISDNASTDETPIFCQGLIRKSEIIRYHRNESNLGPDLNFVNCVNMASGEYIILLGDDDKFEDGSINIVLNLIKYNFGYSLILINSYKKIVSPKIVGTREEFCFTPPKNSTYHNCDQFLRDIDPDPLTFMSSLIFRVSDLKNIDNLLEGVGTHFIHTIWLLKVIKMNPKIRVYSKPLIVAGNAESLDFYQNNSKIEERRKNAEYSQLIVTLDFYSNTFNKQCKEIGYRRLTARTVFNKFLFRQALMKAYTKIQGKDVYLKKRNEIFKFTKNYLISWILFYPVVIIPPRVVARFNSLADKLIEILYSMD